MKKPHYFYKISATSNVGRDIQAFMHRCQEAEEKAREWADKQGASSYYESPEGMAGGVGAVEFADTTGRDGWDKEVSPDGRVFFFPIEGTDYFNSIKVRLKPGIFYSCLKRVNAFQFHKGTIKTCLEIN